MSAGSDVWSKWAHLNSLNRDDYLILVRYGIGFARAARSTPWSRSGLHFRFVYFRLDALPRSWLLRWRFDGLVILLYDDNVVIFGCNIGVDSLAGSSSRSFDACSRSRGYRSCFCSVVGNRDDALPRSFRLVHPKQRLRDQQGVSIGARTVVTFACGLMCCSNDCTRSAFLLVEEKEIPY